MNSPYCIMKRSAMPEKIQVTTCVQEVMRRLRNTHSRVSKGEMDEVLSKFSEKMKRSGYGEGFRRNLMLAGVKGFRRMREEDEAGGRKMYRKQEEGKQARWAQHISEKENWFRGKGKSMKRMGWREIQRA